MSSSRLFYGSTVFLAAFLLFLVEPMAAKQLLPALGGSSTVWLTCLVFFQLTLLLGYLYAHWLTRRPSSARQQKVYLALLALAIAVLAAQRLFHLDLSRGSTPPVTTIFTALTLTIGLPFLLLGSTSPLLQMWLFRSEGGAVPYRLFALSNAGSLLALIAYPTLVEPHLTLRHQRTLWALGFSVPRPLAPILPSRPKATPKAASLATETASADPPTPTATKWLWF